MHVTYVGGNRSFNIKYKIVYPASRKIKKRNKKPRAIIATGSYY